MRPNKKLGGGSEARLLKNMAFRPNYNCTINSQTNGVSKQPDKYDSLCQESSFQHRSHFIWILWTRCVISACGIYLLQTSRQEFAGECDTRWGLAEVTPFDCFQHHLSVVLFRGSCLSRRNWLDKTRPYKAAFHVAMCEAVIVDPRWKVCLRCLQVLNTHVCSWLSCSDL